MVSGYLLLVGLNLAALTFGALTLIYFKKRLIRLAKKQAGLRTELNSLKQKLAKARLKKHSRRVAGALSGIIEQTLSHFHLDQKRIREVIIVHDNPDTLSVAGEEPTGEKLAVILDEAREFVKRTGLASTALLTKKLNISHKEANIILDWLEEEGVIGPADGTSHRSVFVRE